MPADYLRVSRAIRINIPTLRIEAACINNWQLKFRIFSAGYRLVSISYMLKMSIK